MQQCEPGNQPVEAGRGTGQVASPALHLLSFLKLCRPILSSLLKSVYPVPGEEGSEEQKKDLWQPEVQKLCMDLQQLVTR